MKWQQRVSEMLSRHPEFHETGGTVAEERPYGNQTRTRQASVYEYRPDLATPTHVKGKDIVQLKRRKKAAKKGLNSVRMHGQMAGR